MNPDIKKMRSAESPRATLAEPARPEAAGGIPLANLSHSATVRRLAIKRQAVRHSQARTSSFLPGQAIVDGRSPSAPITSQANPETSAESEREARREVGRILELLLADEYMLYKITRDYLWNVAGPDYFSLRLQFQLQHAETAGWVDAVTERIRAMRLDTRKSWAELQASARCSAAPGFELPAGHMLAELLRSHDEMIAQLRSDSETCRQRYGDASTASFLDGLREQHENSAWMLRAQLETAESNQSGAMARFT